MQKASSLTVRPLKDPPSRLGENIFLEECCHLLIVGVRRGRFIADKPSQEGLTAFGRVRTFLTPVDIRTFLKQELHEIQTIVLGRPQNG